MFLFESSRKIHQFSANDLGEAVLPRKCPLCLPHSTHLAITPATPSLTVGEETRHPGSKLNAPLHSTEVFILFSKVFFYFDFKVSPSPIGGALQPFPNNSAQRSYTTRPVQQPCKITNVPQNSTVGRRKRKKKKKKSWGRCVDVGMCH